MELWNELFSDWVGILSFLVILGVIVIGGFMYKWVKNNIAEDEKKSQGV